MVHLDFRSCQGYMTAQTACWCARTRPEEYLMNWTQVYDPLGHWWLSTLVAALPIIVLFSLLAGLRVKPHWCAIAGAGTAVAGAIIFFRMPPMLAALSFCYGVGL